MTRMPLLPILWIFEILNTYTVQGKLKLALFCQILLFSWILQNSQDDYAFQS